MTANLIAVTPPVSNVVGDQEKIYVFEADGELILAQRSDNLKITAWPALEGTGDNEYGYAGLNHRQEFVLGVMYDLVERLSARLHGEDDDPDPEEDDDLADDGLVGSTFQDAIGGLREGRGGIYDTVQWGQRGRGRARGVDNSKIKAIEPVSLTDLMSGIADKVASDMSEQMSEVLGEPVTVAFNEESVLKTEPAVLGDEAQLLPTEGSVDEALVEWLWPRGRNRTKTAHAFIPGPGTGDAALCGAILAGKHGPIFENDKLCLNCTRQIINGAVEPR